MASLTPAHAAELDVLWPRPSLAPPLAPARLPGISPTSDGALLECLKDNHVKWHIYFNNMRFHNHITHHLLALYAMGGSGRLIEAAYKNDMYQRAAFESPEPITQQNFHLHLGDEDFYNAYLKFFTAEVLDKGAAAVLEEYIFSPRFNTEVPEPGKPPMRMLGRFLGGVLHPMIHAGYAAEFGLPGQMVEAIAQAATHLPAASAFTPAKFWQGENASGKTDTTTAAVSRLTSLLPSLSLGPAKAAPKASGVHALTILARLLRDPKWDPRSEELRTIPRVGDPDSLIVMLCERRGAELEALVADWTLDAADPEEVARKIEELIWLDTVIFGVGGFGGRKPGTKFNGDFFLLHLVTCSLFLHSLVAYLSPPSVEKLLRSYLAASLATYVSRGRPPLPIAEFYETVTATPAPPASAAPSTKPAEGALAPEDTNPNPFLPILQSTLMHPDDHSVKLQRSLAHFASLYGARAQGHLAGVELEGAERLDGSLFIRVAGLSVDRTGWMREGEEKQMWDYSGFFTDK